MSSWRKLNGDYEFRFFDDQDAHALVIAVGSRAEVTAYESVLAGASRADLFRVLYLKYFGGVWADLDTEARSPLQEILGGKRLKSDPGSGDTLQSF